MIAADSPEELFIEVGLNLKGVCEVFLWCFGAMDA
jgi:hypothetical protein